MGVLIRVKVRKKESGSKISHVRNKVTLNDEKLLCLRSHTWIKYLQRRLPQIYISYLEPIRIYIKNHDSDTIHGESHGNNLLWFTHQACVKHGHILIQWTTSTRASVKHISHQRDFGKCCMVRVEYILSSIN